MRHADTKRGSQRRRTFGLTGPKGEEAHEARQGFVGQPQGQWGSAGEGVAKTVFRVLAGRNR